MKQDGFNRVEFFNRLVQGSIRTIPKGNDAMDKLYNGYRVLITNQKRSTPERAKECNDLLDMLERTYKMFTDEEVKKIIINNNVSFKQFINIYGEKLLGDNKRQYDMSDRFNEQLHETGRSLYTQSRGKGVHTYFDSEGKEIIIQEIGCLTFEEWNGVNSEIYKYRVQKQSDVNTYKECEVFTNIKFILMENMEYRAAVLEELLSRNNIELSNVGGYIGEIEKAPIDEKEFGRGKEKVMAGNYCYRITPDYMLIYRSAELDAVVRYHRKEIEINNTLREKSLSDDGIIY